jgi:hypothetical protein
MSLSKKFICLEFSDNTNTKLKNWLSVNKVPLPKYSDGEPFHFHVTIMFSENAMDADNEEFNIPPFEVKPTEYAVFGINKDCLVIKLELNNKLATIRKAVTDHGFYDKWDEYKPHLTLSYSYDGSPDDVKLPLPTFPLVVDKIKIEDVKGD